MPRRQSPLTRLDVELPRDLYDRLVAAAHEAGVSVDELVDRAIREWAAAQAGAR